VGVDKVRLTDRFYLGQPDFAGFDIRGLGPRVLRVPYDQAGNLVTDRSQIADDALGGRAYYFGNLDLQIPLGSGVRELGIRPSLFANVGSVFGVKRPILQNIPATGQFRETLNVNGQRVCVDTDVPTGGTADPSQVVSPGTTCPTGFAPAGTTIPGFQEQFLGDTWKPRVSVGIGVNWNSPFGPFRIDIARALIKRKGDDTKLFTFNVGTSFQ
jgi:outer membrane protein insertion porin family